MAGDDRRRFCEQCGKHVYNISAMTPVERAEFSKPVHRSKCITYVHRADGTVMDLSLWAKLRRAIPFLRLIRWSALVALLPAILTGCMGVRAPRVTGIPRSVQMDQTAGDVDSETRLPVPDGAKYQTTVPEK